MTTNGDMRGTHVLSHMTNRVFRDNHTSQASIDCLCPETTDTSIPCLLFGVVIGIVVAKYVQLPSRIKRQSSHTQDSEIRTQEVTKSAPRTGDVAELDAELEVLEDSIPLFAKRFSPEARDFTLNDNDGKTKKVVDHYLSPEELIETLFFEQSGDATTDLKKSCDQSLSLTHPLGSSNKKENMVYLLKQIQKYSVTTDHPYFYNQLFGALDPIATAAELVALSVHTSAYTFETAPVFTMLERHVLEKLGQLVYSTPSSNSNITHDGLMLPGGSLSNLTALHVARHVCKSRGSYEKQQYGGNGYEEEKKESMSDFSTALVPRNSQPKKVAFVSSEAHYSFMKAAAVLGIDAKDIVTVPTLPNGQIDSDELDMMMTDIIEEGTRIPFFVGVTAGSTVRGSFDDIEAVVGVCRKHEGYLNSNMPFSTIIEQQSNAESGHKIWVHVDGAWGGSAIFSPRKDLCDVLKGVKEADSFTFNPHKVLGAPQQTTAFVTRHAGVLKASNSTKAKYLFDDRKNGAEYDLGDGTYTCGRKPDAVKLWAMWKYYGQDGLAKMVETKVDSLTLFAKKVKEHDNFMLACEPWPFNVNFFYLPKRIRNILKERNIDIFGDNSVVPDDLARDLGNVHVQLKKRLHKNGKMLIPFQPLSNQTADCFRVVLAGNKRFNETDMKNIMELMETYGNDL